MLQEGERILTVQPSGKQIYMLTDEGRVMRLLCVCAHCVLDLEGDGGELSAVCGYEDRSRAHL